MCFGLNTEYDPNAKTIGYDVYDRKGSARVLAKGANSRNTPFVGESITPVSQNVYSIDIGVEYKKTEIDAIEARRRLNPNGGAVINLPTKRVETARERIKQSEMEIVFKGNAEYGIAGVFDASFYGAGKGTKETVTDPGSGTTWAVKTPAQILDDLLTARETVENDGIFEVTHLVLTAKAMNQLRKPYSADSQFTVLDWISRSITIPNIIPFQIMTSANSGLGADGFMMYDGSNENLEIALTEEMRLTEPDYSKFYEQWKMRALESLGGIQFRHPACMYIGTGI
jgi:hypothetical protein